MAADRDAGIDPRFDPAFQRGYVPPPPPRVEERGEATRLETPPEQPEQPAHLDPPRRNPFRLILLLASLAALAGAAVLVAQRMTSDPASFGSTGQQGLFTDALVTGAIPALVTGGLIGLALWLSLGALRRRDGE